MRHATIKTVLAAATAAGALGGLGLARAGDFHPGAQPPASARPGQCFGQVSAPGPTHRSAERVLLHPARTEQRWAPAVSRWETRRVLVTPESVETVRIPAVYRTEVSYTYAPGARRIVQRAPTYRRVVERVLVSPAHVVWRRGRGGPGYGGEPGAYALQPTGEVLCRVRVPARYMTRVHLVQTSPGCACEVEGPPVRRRVVTRVLVTPERTVQRRRPAVYRTTRECRIVQPGHAYAVTVPAVYRTVEHVRRTQRAGWEQVVCPNGLAPWAMARLQAALNARGYAAGPEDGVGRPQTYQALSRWQRDNRLPAGQITVESARRLGVTD